jgi:hypothetical protein
MEAAALITICGAAAIGVSGQFFPVTGPFLVLALAFAPFALLIRPDILVPLLIASAVLSRVAIPLGIPRSVAYIHIAFFVLLVVRILFNPQILSTDGRRIVSISAIMAALHVFAAILGGWVGILPIISWVLICEPFIVFAVLISLDESQLALSRRVLLFTSFIQIPVAFTQFLQFGAGDLVRGTLIEQGAGSHVVGAIAMLGAVFFLALSSRSSYPSYLVAIVVGLLSFISVLGDAKQVIAASAIAVAIVWAPHIRKHIPKLLPVVTIAVLALIVAARLNPSLETLTSTTSIRQNLGQKLSYVRALVTYMDPYSYLVGLGPGNGTSRTSLLSIPGFGSLPTALVGSNENQLIQHLTAIMRDFWRGNSPSSTAGPFNSPFALFSDLGVLGLVVYGAMAVATWKACSIYSPQIEKFAHVVLVGSLGLGLLYLWWDEPAFTVFAAGVLGSLPRSRNQTRSRTPNECDGGRLRATKSSHPLPNSRSAPFPRLGLASKED